MISKYTIERIVEYVEGVAKSDIKEEVKRGFRSRARVVPSEISFNGLAYTLVILGSRSSARAIEEMGLKGEGIDPVIKVLGDDGLSKEMGIEAPEKKSYALYASLLLRALAGEMSLPSSYNDLVRRSLSDPLMEAKALEISEWIKRLSEALIPGEE